jgi:dynein light intermediate chain 1
LFFYRIYEGPGNFNTPALVVERDALFIPAGWDSLPKIAILYENIRSAFISSEVAYDFFGLVGFPV